MIERHELTDSEMRRIVRRIKKTYETVEEIKEEDIDLYLLRSLYEEYLELSQYEIFLNNDKVKCWEHLKSAMQVCKAIYKLANNIGEDVEVKLDGIESFTLEGEVKKDFITPWNFTRHLALALLLRDKEACEMLTGLDETIMNPEEAGLSGAAFNISRFHVFNSLFSRDISKDDLVQLIDAAYGEYIEHYGEREEESMSHIRFELLFLKALIEQDFEKVNKIIEERLLNFKLYYSEEDPSSPKGFISLNVTCLAAFAYDQGMEITVESDYMPRFLVEGKFAEEKIKWPMG